LAPLVFDQQRRGSRLGYLGKLFVHILSLSAPPPNLSPCHEKGRQAPTPDDELLPEEAIGNPEFECAPRPGSIPAGMSQRVPSTGSGEIADGVAEIGSCASQLACDDLALGGLQIKNLHLNVLFHFSTCDVPM